MASFISEDGLPLFVSVKALFSFIKQLVTFNLNRAKARISDLGNFKLIAFRLYKSQLFTMTISIIWKINQK